MDEAPPPITFPIALSIPMWAPDDGCAIRLVGDREVFKTLAGRLDGAGHRVVEHAGEYFLVTAEIDPAIDTREIQGYAQNIVQRVNAVGKLALDGFLPVACDGVFWRSVRGIEAITFQSAAIQFPRSVAPRSEPRTASIPTFEELCTALLPTFPDIEAAFRYYGEEDHDWVTLYQLYELIEHHVGATANAARDWVSKKDVTRFKWSANHPGAVGDASRHGHLSQQPPPDPMDLGEARDFIRRLLHGWLLLLYGDEQR